MTVCTCNALVWKIDDVWIATFRFIDRNRLPVDLTGKDILSSIKPADEVEAGETDNTSEIAFAMLMAIDNPAPATGIGQLTYTKTGLAAPGKYVCDLALQDLAGRVHTSTFDVIILQSVTWRTG